MNSQRSQRRDRSQSPSAETQTSGSATPPAPAYTPPSSPGSAAPASPEARSRLDSIANALGAIDLGADEQVQGTDQAIALLQPPRLPAPRRSSRTRRQSEPPHDVADEEPPRDDFYNPTFQQAYGDARALMANLSGVLKSGAGSHDRDSAIQRLTDEAAELALFQCPTTRVVGFVGDSGVGKIKISSPELPRLRLTESCVPQAKVVY